jgi:hypothetical protein
MKPDWSSFTLRIPVNSSIESIYNAWSTSAGIEKWFLASAEFTSPGSGPRDPHDNVQAGDTYLWKWFGFPGGSPEPGKIIEANGRDRVAFTFAKNCTVTISVLNVDGENIVELKQANIPPDENLGIYFGCSSGWIFYMTNLKSILEGGIDLRNKDEKIPKVINA